MAEQFHTLVTLSSVLFGTSKRLLIFPFLPHFFDKWIDAIFLLRREPGPAGGLRGGIGLAKDKPGHSPLTLGPEPGSGQGWGG